MMTSHAARHAVRKIVIFKSTPGEREVIPGEQVRECNARISCEKSRREEAA
jgi:hypothetical protein